MAKFSRLDLWVMMTFLMVSDGVKDVRMTARKLPEVIKIVIGFGIFKIGVDLANIIAQLSP